MRWLLVLGLLVLGSSPSGAQWGTGGCTRSSAKTWHEVEAGVWYLGELNNPVACWYEREHEWFDRVNGKWIGPKLPPWEKPLTGVEGRKLSGNDYLEVGGSQSKEGRRKPKPDPAPAPDGKLPPDDSGKSFVVVIGDDAFIATAKTILANAEDKFFVEYFHPDDWQVNELGYKPGVWIVGPRQPNGRGVALSYSPTVEGILTALRKADPSFDPAKVPDLSKEEILDHFKQVPPCAWAAAGVCVFLFLTRKK